MKLDRLLAIVILLINKRMVQAKDLAERFEVSVRTIYRDIETLGMAGIPVITYQGTNGGIGLSEGYRLDRTVLTDQEFAAIVTALRSVATPTAWVDKDNDLLLEKINSIIPDAKQPEFEIQTNQLLVDFSPWGQHPGLERMLVLLKKAIGALQLVSFTYSNAQGATGIRTVEPYTLVMKGMHWYLHAFCRERGQYRLFKLARMKDLMLSAEAFERRADAVLLHEQTLGWHAPGEAIRIVLRFSANIKHLAEERFGTEALEEEVRGDEIAWLTTVFFPEDAWLYGFILSFGAEVEVVEPEHLRSIIRNTAHQIVKTYDRIST
ncbi:YafY family transcriptional regulator [Paenibacillaceae bacterium]|nr:YafY family transcriptional regulator [Paenibacillaceae bacterium]